MSYICPREGCDHMDEKPWEGRCPACGGWKNPKSPSGESGGRSTFAKAATVKVVKLATGIEGWDAVLDGGFAEATSILFAGQHGAGKSTLSCMVLAAFCEKYKSPGLYVSAEESVDGVLTIVKRAKCETDLVEVMSEGNLGKVLAHARKAKPILTVLDSFNRYAPTPTDEKIFIHHVSKYIRETKSCVLIVQQMAKSGAAKGTTEGPHAFDVVINMGNPLPDDMNAPFPSRDCDTFGVRILYADKNRRGALGTSYWEMQKGTMVCVPPRTGKRRKTKRSRQVVSDDGDADGDDAGVDLRRVPF